MGNAKMADAKIDRSTYVTDFIKGDWDRATFINDPHVDSLVAVIVSLSSELWTMRRRQMVVESLLAKSNLVSAAAIESYEPNEAEKAVWTAERDDTIERIFKALTRVGARATGKPPQQGMVPPLGK
jgi:hypothetical protein